MPGGGHRGLSLPGVGRRVVRLVLAEGPGRRLSPEDKDSVAQDGGRDPAAGGGKVRLTGPAVGGRVVFFGDGEVLAVLPIQPATDGIEATADDRGRVVIAGRRHRGPRGPRIGRRVIDLMSAGVAVPIVAAHGVELAVEHRHRQRPAGGGHGFAGRPPVCPGIVFVHARQW